MLPSATLRQFFLTKTEDQTSDFQEAISALLRLHNRRQEIIKISYTVEFTDLWHLGQSVLSAHWSELLATLNDIKKHNTQRVLDRYFTYEQESVQLCLGTIPVSRELPIASLAMLKIPDLTISELQLAMQQELPIRFFRPGEMHKQLLAQYHCSKLFNAIYCGQGPIIQSLVIPMFAVDDQVFSGLCTSLVDALRVHELTINGAFQSLTPTQRTWRWQLLTYALFSDASRSSIKELNLIGVQLSQHDVDAIAQVLATNLPEPDQHSEDNNVEFVYVPKGANVTIIQSITSPNSVATLETFDDLVLRLLQNDEKHGRLNVLVPGRGNGVLSSDGVYKVLHQTSNSVEITSLSLSIDSNAE
ncbi:hypothetical protein GN244_ATG05337 [Phytophthora infestans]|nr:hypothetical protein GN244_ATG05337 [Phytophthora infestans]